MLLSCCSADADFWLLLWAFCSICIRLACALLLDEELVAGAFAVVGGAILVEAATAAGSNVGSGMLAIWLIAAAKISIPASASSVAWEDTLTLGIFWPLVR